MVSVHCTWNHTQLSQLTVQSSSNGSRPALPHRPIKQLSLSRKQTRAACTIHLKPHAQKRHQTRAACTIHVKPHAQKRHAHQTRAVCAIHLKPHAQKRHQTRAVCTIHLKPHAQKRHQTRAAYTLLICSHAAPPPILCSLMRAPTNINFLLIIVSEEATPVTGVTLLLCWSR